jgi:hypothetical protein
MKSIASVIKSEIFTTKSCGRESQVVFPLRVFFSGEGSTIEIICWIETMAACWREEWRR